MSKDYICSKCKKPFRSLLAGRDDDYLDFLKYFIDRALEDGYTDRDGYYSIKNWLYRLKEKLESRNKLIDQLRRLVKEY